MASTVGTTAKRTLSGAGRRNKGKSGERQVIALLQPVVNEVYVAHGLKPPLLERNLLQANLGGCDLHGLAWFAPEVKLCETFALPAWWKQCLTQAGDTRVPVLFYRRNRVDWQVMMHATLRPGCTAVAIVSVAAFLTWFRLTLAWEVTRETQNQDKP